MEKEGSEDEEVQDRTYCVVRIGQIRKEL